MVLASPYTVETHCRIGLCKLGTVAVLGNDILPLLFIEPTSSRLGRYTHLTNLRMVAYSYVPVLTFLVPNCDYHGCA